MSGLLIQILIISSGKQSKHPFTPGALQNIFEHSAGLPSEACILADNALLIAFLNQQREVTPAFVESAIGDRLKNVGKLDRDTKPLKQKPKKEHLSDKEQEVTHEPK